MSYRGFGGYRAGDYYVPVYRRRRRYRAGDLLDGSAIDTSTFDPSTLSDTGGGVDNSLGTPDFSDVTGGSSTVSTDPSLLGQPGGIPLDTMGLGGISGAIQKFVGGGGPLASFGPGVGAAVGTAATAASSGVGQKVLKRLGRALGMGGKAHRHMNPGNFKALRRSMRRLKSFEHAAKRVYSFTHRAPGRAKFKFPKRRRR